jgi:nicotinamidase-related amidase
LPDPAVLLPRPAALLIIDLQNAIDAPYHAAEGPRNNPQAESNAARLLAVWRKAGQPVIHVRHDSVLPHSAYRPGQPGNDFKPEVMPLPGETILPKRTNSAFIGTPLEADLRRQGIAALVIAGVVTNNSVEATVRMAGNLGFETWLVEDACFAFAQKDYRGRRQDAETVHAMSLANMDSEYARIITTATAITALGLTR